MDLNRTSRYRQRSFAILVSRTVCIGVAFLAMSLESLGTTFGVNEPTRTSQPGTPTWQDDIATLQDAALPLETRTASCRRLLNAPEQGVLGAIVATLGADKRAGDTQQIIVREIGLQPNAAEGFLAPLEAWLKESTPEKHAPLYRAISSIRTRAAARLLLSYARPSATAENREAIFQALARQTGRVDLGSDREAWSRWLDAADQWTDEQWRNQLASNLAIRADTLRVQRDEALRRLVESERGRFLSAPDVKSRSTILAGMLRDELPSIRRLGIELINRELANARELGPDVGAATLDVLRDPSADVRSAAADLIDRLLPIGAPLAIRDALAKERSPNVLAKLLRLARRYPDIAPPEMLIGWLGADTAVRLAAIDAVAALQAAGLLGAPIDLERALRTLRSERPEDLSADGLKLLCELGDESDRKVVAGMLTLPSADARLGAAQALAPFPDRLDEIVAAARNDQTLFAVAAAAIARHRATLAGYQLLITLPAPNPSALREAVNALCSRLSLPDLRDAAIATVDNDVRESILLRVVDLTATSSKMPDYDPFAGANGVVLIDALFLLARTQLDLLKPSAAIGTLELLPDDPALHARERPFLLKAYLYLDNRDEAMALDATADEWLDAMAYSVALPHALAIGVEIDLRFNSALTAEQRSRLESLSQEAKKPRAARSDSGGFR